MNRIEFALIFYEDEQIIDETLVQFLAGFDFCQILSQLVRIRHFVFSHL